jgi:hypothetical protein
VGDLYGNILCTRDDRGHVSFKSGRHRFDVEIRDDRSAQGSLHRCGGSTPGKYEKADLDDQRQQHEEDADRDDPLDRVRTRL